MKVLIFNNKLKNRRSPFTGNFLRSPGESLRGQLEDLNENLIAYILSAFFLPLFFYSGIISQAYFSGAAFSASSIWLLILIAAAFEAHFIYRLVLLLNRRRNFRLGYEGEIAVGQELNQLLRDGYYVYHDFPTEKFNIDHIVVGPTGVYAVETKARQKPTTSDKSSDAKVIYDGQRLQFPDWVETKPLEQARNQAKWFSRWLSSAVGDSIHVQPVVTLPGWFVERKSSNSLSVINPKQFRSILKPDKGNALDESMISRIIHQIDQRCRDIQPRASEGLGGKPSLNKKAGF